MAKGGFPLFLAIVILALVAVGVAMLLGGSASPGGEFFSPTAADLCGCVLPIPTHTCTQPGYTPTYRMTTGCEQAPGCPGSCSYEAMCVSPNGRPYKVGGSGGTADCSDTW